MNIKKVVLFFGFLVFSDRICFGMIGDDTFDIKTIPEVKKIKELDLKIIELNLETRRKFIISNIEEDESFKGEKFFIFMDNYNRLANETLNPKSQNCSSFCFLIQQSVSIEDLYYYFFLDKDNCSVRQFMMELNVKKDIEDPVKDFLNSDFIKTVPYYSDLTDFLNKKIIQDFIAPVKEQSTQIFRMLNKMLELNFLKNRARILKESLLQEINEQQKEIIKPRKVLNDKISKDFLYDLAEMLNSFSSYIKWGQGSLEEIRSRIDILDQKEYQFEGSVLRPFEEEDKKYRKIRRNFLVLTFIYKFKPLPVANYFRYLAQLSLFSGIVYLFKGGSFSLNRLFWKNFVGFPPEIIRAMFISPKNS